MTKQVHYAVTIAVAVTCVLASIVNSAILARTWTEGTFLLFIILNRFLNVMYCLCTFSIGFGVVKRSQGTDESSKGRVLFNAIVITGTLYLAMFAVLQAFAPQIGAFLERPETFDRTTLALVATWVWGQCFFHVVLSFLRGTGQVLLSNVLNFFGSVIAIILVSAVAWKTGFVSLPVYYFSVGLMVTLGCLMAIYRQNSRQSLRADVSLCRSMLEYSGSRFADTLLRLLTFAVLTAVLFYLGGGALAGSFALVATLLRGIESLFQPVVLLILAEALQGHTHRNRQHQIQRLWNGIFLISIPATAVLMYFSTEVFTLWLGNNYSGIGPAFRAASLAFLPMIACVLLSSYLDSHHRISRMSMIRTCSIILLTLMPFALQHFDCLTLVNITLAVAGVLWLQFFLVFGLLKTRHRLRFFDPTPVMYFLRHMGLVWTPK